MNIQGDVARVCKRTIIRSFKFEKPEDGLLAYFGQISAFECTDNLRLTAGPSQPPPHPQAPGLLPQLPSALLGLWLNLH